MKDEVVEVKEEDYGWVSVTDLQITDNDFFIVPFSNECAKGGGYNLTSTNVIISVNRRLPLTIYQNKGETYTFIPAHDTALVLTREYISAGNNLCGSICSRVRTAAEGFGHISTSIDPGWSGQLLISLNNPGKKKIRFLISRENNGRLQYMPFATLRMQRFKRRFDLLNNEVVADNPDARVDIMQTLCWKHNRPFNYLTHRQFQEIISIIKSEKITLSNEKFNENFNILNQLKSEIDISTNGSYDQIRNSLLKVLNITTDNVILKNQILEIKEHYKNENWEGISTALIYAMKTSRLEKINQIVCLRNESLDNITQFSWNTKPIEDIALRIKFNYLKLVGYIAIILVLVLSWKIFSSLDSFWTYSVIPIVAVVITVLISRLDNNKL